MFDSSNLFIQLRSPGSGISAINSLQSFSLLVLRRVEAEGVEREKAAIRRSNPKAAIDKEL